MHVSFTCRACLICIVTRGLCLCLCLCLFVCIHSTAYTAVYLRMHPLTHHTHTHIHTHRGLLGVVAGAGVAEAASVMGVDVHTQALLTMSNSHRPKWMRYVCVHVLYGYECAYLRIPPFSHHCVSIHPHPHQPLTSPHPPAPHPTWYCDVQIVTHSHAPHLTGQQGRCVAMYPPSSTSPPVYPKYGKTTNGNQWKVLHWPCFSVQCVPM